MSPEDVMLCKIVTERTFHDSPYTKYLNSRMPRIPEEYGGCGGGRDKGLLIGSMQVPLDKMGQL